jgi:hypothetical protein
MKARNRVLEGYFKDKFIGTTIKGQVYIQGYKG